LGATESTATEPTATESTATEPTATESTATEPTATESTATESTANAKRMQSPLDEAVQRGSVASLDRLIRIMPVPDRGCVA
jgi:hypothetical protein